MTVADPGSEMPKLDWEGCVFARGRRLYLKVKYPEPKGWLPVKTPFMVGQEALAERLLKRTREAMLASESFADETGLVTVRSFGIRWIDQRKKVSSWRDDRSHLEQHVYPSVGDMPVGDVRPRHLRTMVRSLEGKKINRKIRNQNGELVASSKALSAKSIHNIYGTCVSLFRDAAIEGEIDQTPAILTKEHLPAIEEGADDWREDAIFELHEIEKLISDERIPFDRRVCYGIAFLGCTRFGEMSALRWKRYDTNRQPLGALHLRRSYNTRNKAEKSTKTGRPRVVPVHPVLAKILAEWKLQGWPEQMGRSPTPDDLIVPSRGQGKRLPGFRSASHMLKRFHQDCLRIKIRVRRQHDSRRTWISIARSAGVNDKHREWISHGPDSSVGDGYTTMFWPELCAVVMAIRVGLNEGKILLGAFGAVSALPGDSAQRSADK